MHPEPTETAPAASNIAEYTVTELSGALKRTVEEAFGHVRVRGEISGYRGRHASGHAYFTLKDERSRLEAVIWRGTFARLRFLPEEGMEVVATGKLTTYPGSSKYQIVIDQLEPAGAGALMMLLEARKKKLAAEGLFDESRKRRFPFLPRVIGVVTSPTGAVIRDIVHRISDRFPLHVLVWPIRVQGETSGDEAAAAIAGFNALPVDGSIARPDLIIVARGGGSLEDLWGFNDEALVRSVAASAIPVISAVGHETDWTLIDLAADLRAPTPTAAAELAVPVRAELEAALANLGARLQGAISRKLDRERRACQAASRALPSADSLLAMPRRHLDEMAARLERGLTAHVERKRLHFDRTRLAPQLLVRMLRERRQALAACAARVRPERLRERVRRQREQLAILTGRADRGLEQMLQRCKALVIERERLMNSLSYLSVLRRGFVLVHDTAGAAVTRAAQLRPGFSLRLQFHDGEVDAVVSGGGAPSRRKSTKRTISGQSSLFDEE